MHDEMPRRFREATHKQPKKLTAKFRGRLDFGKRLRAFRRNASVSWKHLLPSAVCRCLDVTADKERRRQGDLCDMKAFGETWAN